MNVQQANQNLLLLCRDCRDTSKAERDAARLALEQAVEEENVSESKPPGYTTAPSGSGASLVLRCRGKWLDSEPRCGDDKRAERYLTGRAWKHYQQEMERLKGKALRA